MLGFVEGHAGEVGEEGGRDVGMGGAEAGYDVPAIGRGISRSGYNTVAR